MSKLNYSDLHNIWINLDYLKRNDLRKILKEQNLTFEDITTFDRFFNKFDDIKDCAEFLKKLEIQNDRIKYLNQTDWTMLADAPLSGEAKKEIRAYRQYLRDFPEIVANKQTQNKVMKFEEWQENKPVYKVDKTKVLF
jgi:hypothetical protein